MNHLCFTHGLPARRAADVDEQEPGALQARSFAISERCDGRRMGAYRAAHSSGEARGRKREVEARDVVDGIMYVLSTGCQWRYIPKQATVKKANSPAECGERAKPKSALAELELGDRHY